MGPGRIRKLLQAFPTVSDLERAPLQHLTVVEGIDKTLGRQIKSGGNWGEAERQVKLLKNSDWEAVTLWDDSYPDLLRQISDPPLLLFVKGELTPEDRRAIGIVGTRSPSGYGKVVTTQLTKSLIEHRITTVSGLARGVDTIVHSESIQNGGRTIAVLGCGPDKIYPPENRELYKKIPEKGALVTEFFFGVGPDATNFPRRNRIISGLSLGTLVIEAGERSGALITAGNALNQNREVFAVPGNINSPKSIGCNNLIKQGAKLVQSVEDILEEIPELRIDQSQAINTKVPPADLGDLERKILESLSHEPIHVDRLVNILNEPPGAILSGLLTLELLGLARQLAGKMFVRL